MSTARCATSLRPLPAARVPSRQKAEPGPSALAAWGFSFHFKYFSVVFFRPSDTWNDLSVAGAQFGPDAFCLLAGGVKHLPAGIGAVGEGLVPTEGREAAGTQGPRQLPEMGPVHGAGTDLQWVAPAARLARERGCPR